MTKFTKRMVSALSAGAMLLSLSSPVMAATTLEITGNGADSTSTVKLENTGATYVAQDNTAVVTNDIHTSSNTGENTASKNTGGGVTVMTGDASTDVKVANVLNTNTASVNCCSAQGVDVLVSGNGADTANKVEVATGKDISVYQDNLATVKNDVSAKTETGDNSAYKNTGGDVVVVTGDAKTSVDIATTANSNSASVGGEGGTTTSEARIIGNGADSNNSIKLGLGGTTYVVQDNRAEITNIVKEAKANTGDNKAIENTGGEVVIATGDATTTIGIDNMVNFNWASVDCGCTTDLLAKVAGNGADTKNKIEAQLGGDLSVLQGKEQGGNYSHLLNSISGGSESGDNSVMSSTGDPGSDPTVMTGDSASVVDVANSGNVNSYGVGIPSDWPSFQFGFELPNLSGWWFHFSN